MNRRLTKELRCSRLSRQRLESQREADAAYREYQRHNDLAEATFEKAEETTSEQRAERLWSEWDRQRAVALADWNRHAAARKLAQKLSRAWARSCGRSR